MTNDEHLLQINANPHSKAGLLVFGLLCWLPKSCSSRQSWPLLLTVQFSGHSNTCKPLAGWCVLERQSMANSMYFWRFFFFYIQIYVWFRIPITNLLTQVFAEVTWHWLRWMWKRKNAASINRRQTISFKKNTVWVDTAHLWSTEWVNNFIKKDK